MASTSGISHHYTCNANHLGIESYVESKEKAVKANLNISLLQIKDRIRHSFSAYAFLSTRNFQINRIINYFLNNSGIFHFKTNNTVLYIFQSIRNNHITMWDEFKNNYNMVTVNMAVQC